jgi:hypothetical protein
MEHNNELCVRARVHTCVHYASQYTCVYYVLQVHDREYGDYCSRGAYPPNVSLTKSPVMPMSISEITKSLPVPSKPVWAAHALMIAPDSGITLPSSRVQVGSWPFGVVGFRSGH